MKREWSQEELNYLKENVGIYKIATIAKKLNRSYESINQKINRLGLANTKIHTGFITLGELARYLKIDRNTVKCWVRKYGLPCIKRVTRKSKVFYFVNPSEFWKWAEVHKDKVKFSDIEKNTIIPEPSWVDEERQKDQDMTKKRTYKNWTTLEDEILLELRQNGLTYKEIGILMNRSSISVERRYNRIISRKNRD
ncbi:MerR family transcriptional regulator [Calidifontibacillus erzurumensis]|uniref:Helix-turn-helix domain-containing protein n=1 Tax=Calidifontibacillus erzurumensis TaxID=2741433 RepID=A0A8J8KC64_9BACI|nr:helix-turn-helix domain-containing protein [Calidifontibacillus erzurumensis]NSL52719.1 helix-turn-helix domain-containing protein [Calidifontibacillus erzurumensis]